MHLLEQVTQPADPSYRLIVLTRSQACKVDSADYEWLNQWKWCAIWNPLTQSFYAQRNFRKDDGNRSVIQMQRQILNPPAGRLADHRNHDTLDNRRQNLRIATRSQNSANAKIVPAGVCLRSHGKWQAQIAWRGKKIFLGHFDSSDEARSAYLEAANKLHGEFARL